MLASVYFYEKMFLYKKEGNLSTFGKKTGEDEDCPFCVNG